MWQKIFKTFVKRLDLGLKLCYVGDMANMMKTLMDDFAEEASSARADGDWEDSFIFDSCESIANNCHGKSTVEVLDFMKSALESNRDNAATKDERSAWESGLIIVQLRRDEMTAR